MDSSNPKASIASLARRLALTPVWTAQLLTASKSFAENRVLGSGALNRLGLHRARVRAAHAIARRRREQLAALVTEADRSDFARDGFVVRESFLPPSDFARLLESVRRYRGEAREKVEGNTLMRKITLDAQARRDIDGLETVLENPAWRGLISYVGTTRAPPVIYLQTLFRNQTSDEPDPQARLHSDTFHPTVKAWLYLTDVDIAAGPLLYVPGSHHLSERRLDWEAQMSLRALDEPDADTRDGSFRVSESDLKAIGLPRPRPLTVPANTLVVVDTHGFHARGPAADGGFRVELWAIGRRAPFLPPSVWIRRLESVGRRRDPDEWRSRSGVGAFAPPSPR